MSESSGDDFLSSFHAGTPATLEACYRDHFAAVTQAVRRLLPAADAETVVHEVFYRLLSSPELRRNFTGGSLSAWMNTVARNQALDQLRRTQREQAAAKELAEDAADAPPPENADDHDYQELVARFRTRLPEKWLPVFQARFLEQRTQREAAAQLKVSRTTLAYQEMRIRSQLRSFMLEDDP